MSANFSTLNLSGERVVVRGQDSQGVSGETTLNARQWNAIKARRDGNKAEQEFNDTVLQFFEPITQAADKLAASQRGDDVDPITFVEFEPRVEGTSPHPGSRAALNRDSIVLRLLEEGDHDRLVWVRDELEVLEIVPGTGSTQGSGGTEPHEDFGDVLDRAGESLNQQG